MAIVANFGRSNFSTSSGGGSTPTDYAHIVYSATKVGDTTNSTITLEEGGMYLMVTDQWTTSTGVHYGASWWRLCCNIGSAYGSTAVLHNSISSSSSQAISFTWNTDSTISWKCTSTAYTVKVVIMKIG